MILTLVVALNISAFPNPPTSDEFWMMEDAVLQVIENLDTRTCGEITHCTTDSDCAEKCGGNGDPEPEISE